MEPEDTIVFDIETSNFFTTPGVGWGNYGKIEISVVGFYSYLKDAYFCLEVSEKEELMKWFAQAKTIIGFASNRYDIPVLNLYFRRWAQDEDPELDLWRKKRIDLLEIVESATGKRVSLSHLAELNLGEKKDRQGHEAITLFEEGRIEELKEYCLKDVRLTKELYDLYNKERALIVPHRGSTTAKRVEFGTSHVSKQTPLF